MRRTHRELGSKAPERTIRPVPPSLARREAPACNKIYSQIEAILAALPPDMPEATRREAGNLLLGLFADYLAIRLGEADHGA